METFQHYHGGASLSGTPTVAALDGRATFTDLRIDKDGLGYALIATATGFGSATSAAIAMMPVGRIAFVRVRQVESEISAVVACGNLAKESNGRGGAVGYAKTP